MATAGLAQEVKTRPIIFGADSVRAILDGRKTQTRRVMTPQPHFEPGTFPPGVDLLWWHWSKNGGSASHDPPGVLSETWLEHCPYGQRGDRLWVREAWQKVEAYNGFGVCYRADDEIRRIIFAGDGDDEWPGTPVGVGEVLNDFGEHPWRTPLFMPRWASRITLELTDVRVERVQDIGHDDALAEGVQPPTLHVGWKSNGALKPTTAPRAAYQAAWDSLNKARGFGWDVNPFVWVLTFKRLTPTQPAGAQAPL